MPVAPRRRLIRLAVMLALLAPVFISPAMGQRLRIIPVPPNIKAQWLPIPDLPQVSYAPNIPTDVFRHRDRYYFYWEGAWYHSNKIQGPYLLQANPPAILANIQASYFKTLPRGPAPPESGAVPEASLEEGLVTPDGKPVVPPAPAPPQTLETGQPPKPETASPESQEPAPPAKPEGPMPKAM